AKFELARALETANGERPHIAATLFWNRGLGGSDIPKNSWLADSYDLAKRTTFSIEDRWGKHTGSGSFLSEDGFFASAKHVLEKASKGKIRMANGESYAYSMRALDTKADAAIGKVMGENGKKFDFLEIGSPTAINSRRAAAFGYPGPEAPPWPVAAPGSVSS